MQSQELLHLQQLKLQLYFCVGSTQSPWRSLRKSPTPLWAFILVRCCVCVALQLHHQNTSWRRRFYELLSSSSCTTNNGDRNWAELELITVEQQYFYWNYWKAERREYVGGDLCEEPLKQLRQRELELSVVVRGTAAQHRWETGPITAVTVCIAVTCSYIFAEVYVRLRRRVRGYADPMPLIQFRTISQA